MFININTNRIITELPAKIILDGSTVHNPSKESLLSAGWQKVANVQAIPENHRVVSTATANDNGLTCDIVYETVLDPAYTEREEYKAAAVAFNTAVANTNVNAAILNLGKMVKSIAKVVGAGLLLAAISSFAVPPNVVRQWQLAAHSGATSIAIPLTIPNCGLWLDASDVSTITMSGTAITGWADKSGERNDAAQLGADSTRPTYGVTDQNGLATVSFDGGDYLGTGYVNDETITAILVMKRNTMTPEKFSIGSKGTATTRSFWGVGNSATKAYGAAGLTASSTVAYTWGTGFSVFQGTHGGSVVNIYKNGAYSDGFAYGGVADNTTAPYYVGTFNNAGSPYSAYFNGHIGEIICYRRVISTAERATITAYLKTKWGIE